jgi:hypothetical protein
MKTTAAKTNFIVNSNRKPTETHNPPAFYYANLLVFICRGTAGAYSVEHIAFALQLEIVLSLQVVYEFIHKPAIQVDYSTAFDAFKVQMIAAVLSIG